MVEMKEKPLVSVIIPTFKRPKLLQRAVESVKNQTYSNIEIIVIDDSNDEEVKNLYRHDPKINLVVNKKNMGGGYSRNKGLDISKGQYINFLDDDDIIFPTKIEEQVNKFLINPSKIRNLGFVTCHTNDSRSGESLVKKNLLQGNIFKNLLKKYLLEGTETVLYVRRNLIKISGFDETLVANQEYDLLIRYSEYWNVDYVDKVLSKRYSSSNQISKNFRKKRKGARQLYLKHTIRFKKEGFFFFVIITVKYILLYLKFLFLTFHRNNNISH